MAAITPTQILRESLGSVTALFVTIATTTTSDTWTIAANSPVISWSSQSTTGTNQSEPDITWTASTGAFLFSAVSSNIGALQMIVYLRT